MMKNVFSEISRNIYIAIASAILIIAYTYYESIENLVRYWYGHEEFGHAFFIPLISLYLIWQKRFELYGVPIKNTWVGLLITFFGTLLFLLGSLSAIYIIQQYALVFVLIGLFVSTLGVDAAKKVVLPLVLLFFMIPLPGFLYNTLSGQLQLISSEIGVFVIRLFDISVYLEGNVIDLGVYQLQVVEACSGLRYLFPLMTLGLIMSYMYKSTWLNKAILFFSTIPITVLMNSFRIGVIGVMVEYWGIEMAEGFLHDFEGWIVFMACMVVLLVEMWLLNFFTGKKTSFSDIFDLDVIEARPSEASSGDAVPVIPRTVIFVLPILILGMVVSSIFDDRQQVIPDRLNFSQFPLKTENYTGVRGVFEADIINALNFDDYLTADYKNISDAGVYNIYIGYYNTQNVDKVPHSPKACLPGGGWVISNSDVVEFSGNDNVVISANRVVIQQGDSKQLVYYWFKQRDRIVTNEYLVKWYLLVDSIAKNRTDGALVRYTTPMTPNEDLESAEERLRRFIVEVNPITEQYMPD